jgi:hypothetical protein
MGTAWARHAMCESAFNSTFVVFVCKDVDENKRGKMTHNQDETEAKQGKQEKGDSNENEIRACGQ